MDLNAVYLDYNLWYTEVEDEGYAEKRGSSSGEVDFRRQRKMKKSYEFLQHTISIRPTITYQRYIYTLTRSPTSLTSSVVFLPTSTLTNSAGSLSRISICRRPNSKSFLPIEEDTAEKNAMLIVLGGGAVCVVGESSAYRRAEGHSISTAPAQ